MAGVVLVGTTAPATAEQACVNAAARAQTGSTELPECRGYEMVSAPYKGGFPVEINARFTDDGIISYLSNGSFAGNVQGVLTNRYHATRSSAGWVTSAIDPPNVTYNTLGRNAQTESRDLRWVLWEMSRRDVPGDTYDWWLRGPDGAFTRVGSGVNPSGVTSPDFAGGSDDLSHIVFNYGAGPLWEYVGTGNKDFARPVAVDNDGQPTPQGACVNDVSSDGRVIVFSSKVTCSSDPVRLWARVAGTATVAVSGSECTRTGDDLGGLCNAFSEAAYAGAADDGSRVFFTSRQQLVNGDIDTGNSIDPAAGSDLYACDIPAGIPAPVGATNGCSALTEVSGAASKANVERVVAVSKDGSRVYFIAQGVLADNLGVGGVGPASVAEVPVPHNLYMWERDGAHPAGATRFVARLDASDASQGQMTPDGRYLLFLTTSNLVSTGPGADGDGGVDAYRYDAVTGSVVRVSTSVTGIGGSQPGFDVSLVQDTSSMSADGSTVIFDSAEALSVTDTNGMIDVYAWHRGQVSSISARGGLSVGVSPSGRDIFFTTDAPVLAADRDFNKDIYDARIGGGFAPVINTPCTGDECQGQESVAPSLPGPVRGGSGRPDGIEVTPAFSLRAVSAAQRRALAATGKVSLTVMANVAGAISIKATATIAGRSVTVGSVRRSLSGPGLASVALSLSKKARAQLAKRGKLAVRVTVAHSEVALDRSVKLQLVHVKAKAKRSIQGRSAVAVAGARP